MSYRPHPNANRALRQLDRHRTAHPVTPAEVACGLGKAAGLYLAAAHETLRPFREVFEALQAQQYRPHALYAPKSGKFELLDH
ncbi:hypothetical protein [Streptomyces goshikiensis]|uniref:hypothetical protein n=1 Tax=Streptomyces goshikiensis TaxID=1942 RepID=UPI003653FBC5